MTKLLVSLPLPASATKQARKLSHNLLALHMHKLTLVRDGIILLDTSTSCLCWALDACVPYRYYPVVQHKSSILPLGFRERKALHYCLHETQHSNIAIEKWLKE